MSMASFSTGHVEGAYTMHLRIPQSTSKRTRCFTSTILPIQHSSTHRVCIVLGAGFVKRNHFVQACLHRRVDEHASPFGRA